jgi:hypothetical protein
VPRCSGFKADGSACERIVPQGVNLYYPHDPARTEARKKAASKAGRARGPVAELVELRSMVKRYMQDVETGKLEKGKGSVLAQLAGVAGRLYEAEAKLRELEESRIVETQLKVREQEQLIERPEALEELLAEKNGRRGWGA